MQTGRFAGVLVLTSLLATLPFDASAGGRDVLLEWNEIMTNSLEGLPPPEQNRVAAITQLAVFEAVNAVTGKYEPHLGTVHAARQASARAAIVAAAHTVLASYFPERQSTLDAARERSLAAIPDGPRKSAGIALGEGAATAMIAARANDGSEAPEFHLPRSTAPGEWQLTPDCPAEGGVLVHFRNVKPFGIRRADQFRSEPPPALDSLRYAQDYAEVKEVGGSDSAGRPADRARVALFYEALSDAPLWNAVARQIAAVEDRSLAENARAFALINMALSDAGVAVLETKYHYDFWRPETAIREGARDGNDATEPDPAFAPFVVAPCFPSYPSGHAATSYAAREIIERIYGRGRHALELSVPALPGVTLRYKRLAEVTRDIDDARVYGGIHFRFDQEEAAGQGRRIGAYVLEHNLRPRRERGCERD